VFKHSVRSTARSPYRMQSLYRCIEQTYYLSYDGGCIKFPIPDEYEHLYRSGTELPLEFPVRLVIHHRSQLVTGPHAPPQRSADASCVQNGLTPAATGLVVFSGDNYQSPRTPSPIKKCVIVLYGDTCGLDSS
jgi:hypothetical protein